MEIVCIICCITACYYNIAAVTFVSMKGGSAVARVSEAPPEISRGAPHTLLAYYYELQ